VILTEFEDAFIVPTYKIIYSWQQYFIYFSKIRIKSLNNKFRGANSFFRS